MKKLSIILTVVMTLLWHQSNSQILIAVHHNGVPVFYPTVDAAITNAQEGDTIYLPGGMFSLSVNISKRIHIVGAGHNPDSTTITNITQLTAPINIVTGADGGSLTGVKTCDLNFGTSASNQDIHNYTISRCWIGSCDLGYSESTTSDNNYIIENILFDLNGAYAQNNIFLNNVIGWAKKFYNDTFKNNIFLGGINYCGLFSPSSEIVKLASYSIFENNIFNSCGGQPQIFSSNIMNNIFDGPFDPDYTNNCANNIKNQSLSSIFVNESSFYFNYSHDYHLKSTCPGVNAGKDGTDIGIYGGRSPWKPGSVPFNPHFQTFIVGSTTDSTGNLDVNIKVSAQDR